jgi:hypothetical protein
MSKEKYKGYSIWPQTRTVYYFCRKTDKRHFCDKDCWGKWKAKKLNPE